MRLNNKVFAITIYFAALIANFSFLMKTLETPIWVLVVFIMAILMNHTVLAFIASKINQNDINYSVVAVGVLGKLFVLLFGFFIAMSHTDKSSIFLVGSYIFQLIILVLSITRIT